MARLDPFDPSLLSRHGSVGRLIARSTTPGIFFMASTESHRRVGTGEKYRFEHGSKQKQLYS